MRHIPWTMLVSNTGLFLSNTFILYKSAVLAQLLLLTVYITRSVLHSRGSWFPTDLWVHLQPLLQHPSHTSVLSVSAAQARGTIKFRRVFSAGLLLWCVARLGRWNVYFQAEKLESGGGAEIDPVLNALGPLGLFSIVQCCLFYSVYLTDAYQALSIVFIGKCNRLRGCQWPKRVAWREGDTHRHKEESIC